MNNGIPPIVYTIKAIANRHCATTSGLDVLRIGYFSLVERPPPSLIITVKPNTVLSWDQGCALAREIIEVVRSKCSDLGDVQCEIFETMADHPWA